MTVRPALALALALAGLAAPAARAAEPPSPVTTETLKKYQEIFVREQGRQLDQLMTQMTGPGVHLADTKVASLAEPAPGGTRALLAVSRPGPEAADRWLLYVVEPTKLQVTAAFDFLDAFGIERVLWLDENRFLLLDRSVNLMGPPGRLYHVNLVTARADLVDSSVWRFEAGPGGDDVVVETSEDPREPYATRFLYHLRLSTRERRKMAEARHPLLQFGALKGFEAESSFFRFELDRYTTDKFEPTREPWCFDLMAGRTFRDEGSPQAAGSTTAPATVAPTPLAPATAGGCLPQAAPTR